MHNKHLQNKTIENFTRILLPFAFRGWLFCTYILHNLTHASLISKAINLFSFSLYHLQFNAIFSHAEDNINFRHSTLIKYLCKLKVNNPVAIWNRLYISIPIVQFERDTYPIIIYKCLLVNACVVVQFDSQILINAAFPHDMVVFKMNNLDLKLKR